MSLHLNPPFRAEHIGSLLRPEQLYNKRLLFSQKKCSLEELRSEEDGAIDGVVKLQQDAGIKTITDGELRRAYFFEGVFDNLDGMTYIPSRPIMDFKSYIPHIEQLLAAGITATPTVHCTGKIKRRQPFYKKQFEYLKSIVAPEDVKNIKITMCSPSWFHQFNGPETYDLSVYKNDDEYFDALGVVYREEIKELYDLGCRHLQIDDPAFCYFCNENMVETMEKAGVDHSTLLDTYIRAINVCFQGRPEDLTVGVHMCRGNYKGGVHFSEGPYDRIAEKVFNTLDVDAFYLEYDTDRAGDFSALKYMPNNKTVVLGLVTTKSPKLESMEHLKARVNEAAEVMSSGNPNRTKEAALNQICISTQCGFASGWEGNPLTEDDERKKLSLLVETAKQIWPN